MRELHAVAIEKKIIAVALIISTGHLILIAYAAYALGIEVPGCVKDVKPFTAGKLIKQGDQRYEVHMVAKMWSFEPSALTVPLGSTVDLYLISKDVLHGFQIESTNVNLMAVPHVVNYARVKFTRPGTYHVICHEYCGAGHHDMNAVFQVRADVPDAVAEGLAPEPGVLSPAAAAGQKLLQDKGCIACHSLNGAAGVGPTFKGLFGRQETLVDGSTITVDEAYVRESIREPLKRVVNGFNPLMPPLPVTEEELNELVEFLKTAK